MLKTCVALALFASAASVNAATVLFSDDFESDTPTLAVTTTLTKWTVTGNVDVVGMPNIFGITCTGNCVDLDGTTGPGSLKSAPIAFAKGGQVRIQFDLSGSQRSASDDGFAFQVQFAPSISISDFSFTMPGGSGGGGFIPVVPQATFSALVPGNSPWTTYVLEFTPLVASTMTLAYFTNSADNIGPLLDNVRVTQGVIPEPATWAMLIAGFGLVGAAARRRRTAVAA